VNRFFAYFNQNSLQVIVILIILLGELVGNAFASPERNGVKND
jgi:hypothetical protein